VSGYQAQSPDCKPQYCQIIIKNNKITFLKDKKYNFRTPRDLTHLVAQPHILKD
jgi:hypothetical protein